MTDLVSREEIYDALKEAVDALPSVKSERDIAEWKVKSIESYKDIHLYCLYCSNCHYENVYWYDWKFCPNCGAEMRKDQ